MAAFEFKTKLEADCRAQYEESFRQIGADMPSFVSFLYSSAGNGFMLHMIFAMGEKTITQRWGDQYKSHIESTLQQEIIKIREAINLLNNRSPYT